MKSEDQQIPQQLPSLYTCRDITAKGRFSKSHLYNLMSRGHFPRPMLVHGPRFTRWSANEVDAWFSDPQAFVAKRADAPVSNQS